MAKKIRRKLDPGPTPVRTAWYETLWCGSCKVRTLHMCEVVEGESGTYRCTRCSVREGG